MLMNTSTPCFLCAFLCVRFQPSERINPVAGFARLTEGHARRQIAEGFHGGHRFHHKEADDKIDQCRPHHINKSVHLQAHKIHHAQQNIMHQINGQGQGNHGNGGQNSAFLVAVLLEKQENTRRKNDFKSSALRLKC